MSDPLHPGTASPMNRDDEPATTAAPEDDRPWWKRLLTSVRPTVTLETDKKTGKKIETVGVKGGVEF